MAQKNEEVVFSDEQVEKLNNHQADTRFHPYTCCSGDKNTPNCKRASGEDEGKLIATNKGWVCPCGEYTQNWAHGIND
jgi:hypothetical protein